MPDRGLRGIAYSRESIFIAASDEIFEFDQHFNIINSYRNHYLKHAHEIISVDNYLYVTSTGYDAILRLDLATGIFDLGWRFSSSQPRRYRSNYRVQRFDPQAPVGPQRSNEFHINSIFEYRKKIYINGKGIGNPASLESGKCSSVNPIPFQTHNVLGYDDGLVYNDTASDRLMFSNNRRCSALPIHKMNEALITHTESAEKGIARAHFARGLCIWNDSIAIAGSSPSTITAYDIESLRPLKSIVLSRDVRNAVHGLEVWPY